MKIRYLLLSAIFILTAERNIAQETQLSLEEAVNLALTESDEAKIAESRVNTAVNELKVTTNNQYPDVKLSGQYSYLTNADVNLQLNTGQNNAEEAGSGEAPDIHQLLLGQANISMPLFAGFKLKNAVAAGKNNLKAAEFNSENSKEGIALNTIQAYLNLYKAQKTVDLLEESLKSAQQRVKDFSAMEENGLLARNDLLKAQLQESNTELSLEEAKKNAEILNFRLATLLKLPEDTRIQINDSSFAIASETKASEEINRNDLEALRFQEKAAENAVKMAKSNYFPSVALVGGYVALDLQNALTVSNAMNVGVGVSYNLADIFKNKSEVKVAKSKTEELQHSIDLVKDQIKIQVKNAEKDYELALKKLNVYTKSEEQAVENFRIVKDKYDNGLLDTNDLLEADVEQLQAKINLAYAQAEISEKYYEVQKAKGTLTNEFRK